jgi:hypothetical protein
VKNVGKPCDREGHARIDGGRLETGHLATDSEKNNPVVGNHRTISGSQTYSQTTLPRQSPTLLRWGNSARKFSAIDSYVHQRLAILASNKEGRRGRNWKKRFTYSWVRSLGIHRLSGTIRYYRTAHA